MFDKADIVFGVIVVKFSGTEIWILQHLFRENASRAVPAMAVKLQAPEPEF